MPSIDEINESAFLNRQLDLYNQAIAILDRGDGAIWSMQVASKEVPNPADNPGEPVQGLVILNMMPPIDNQDALNVLSAAFKQAAGVIEQKLLDMGFTPSTPDGSRKARQTPYSWMLTTSSAMANTPFMSASPQSGENVPSWASPHVHIPPQFSIYPYQMTGDTTPPPDPVPPSYPVNPPDPPPPLSENPAPPPTLDPGQPPDEFPSEPPDTGEPPDGSGSIPPP